MVILPCGLALRNNLKVPESRSGPGGTDGRRHGTLRASGLPGIMFMIVIVIIMVVSMVASVAVAAVR